MTKNTTPRRTNRADATLRNVQASHRRDEVLAARIKALEDRVASLEHALRSPHALRSFSSQQA